MTGETPAAGNEPPRVAKRSRMPGAMSLADVRLDAVHARMRRAVTPDEPTATPLFGWLRGHLGWPDGGVDSRAASAKGLRPRVVLVAWAGAGGAMDDTAAIDVAAAIELTHEFSLVHDDIEDGDRLRRGRPTLWTVVGVPQAINAGDALFGIARQVLMHAPVSPAALVAMARRYDEACVRLAVGQSLDLAFEAADVQHVTPLDYLGMVRAKTGALLGAAAALGALGAGGDEDTASTLATWGEHVGTAFQIQDDVLGLWGDPAVTGKPVGHDVLRRKKGLPLLLGAVDPTTADRVQAALTNDALDEAQAAELARALERAGIRDACRHWADRRAADADTALDGLAITADARAALRSLSHLAVNRDR
jgi:geranylgeranyl diphosphate synthase type I